MKRNLLFLNSYLVLCFKEYHGNLARRSSHKPMRKWILINPWNYTLSVQIKDYTKPRQVVYVCEFSWIIISNFCDVIDVYSQPYKKCTLLIKMIIRGRRRIKTFNLTKGNRKCFHNNYCNTHIILICVYGISFILCQEISVVSVFRGICT